MHLGFERPGYPGYAVMRSLVTSSSVSFAAVPLADLSWTAAIPALRDIGCGFAPFYVGEQAKRTMGRAGALDAAKLAQQAGIDLSSVLYLDIRATGRLRQAHFDYVAGWIAGIRDDTAYWAGVRCSHLLTAAQLNEAFDELPTWIFNAPSAGRRIVDPGATSPPHPTNSGYPDALLWQYRDSNPGPLDLVWLDRDSTENVRLRQVGLISSVVPDPADRLLVRGSGRLGQCLMTY